MSIITDLTILHIWVVSKLTQFFLLPSGIWLKPKSSLKWVSCCCFKFFYLLVIDSCYNWMSCTYVHYSFGFASRVHMYIFRVTCASNTFLFSWFIHTNIFICTMIFVKYFNPFARNEMGIMLRLWSQQITSYRYGDICYDHREMSEFMGPSRNA